MTILINKLKKELAGKTFELDSFDIVEYTGGYHFEGECYIQASKKDDRCFEVYADRLNSPSAMAYFYEDGENITFETEEKWEVAEEEKERRIFTQKYKIEQIINEFLFNENETIMDIFSNLEDVEEISISLDKKLEEAENDVYITFWILQYGIYNLLQDTTKYKKEYIKDILSIADEVKEGNMEEMIKHI
ncbi:MAG: hypothetical protein RR420_08505 [Anaerovoracaceae bacterium]